jgi:hydroxyethylthiazole kinase-like uncharacterized protein yjeF
VLVVAGPGNNGGDGFVAARVLAARGYGVRVMLPGDRSALRGDAALAAQSWTGPVEPAPETGSLGDCDVIVDALLGAGLSRPVEGVARALIEAMNAAGVPVVAVDLPSGVDGASGAVMGAAVQATATVTFFRRKPGHLLLPGRVRCGTLTVADIGIDSAVLAEIAPQTFANEPSLWLSQFPVPRIDGHKYSRGHAVVVSGGVSSTGAARLAARGALRAGAGLVTLATPRSALMVNAAASLAVMVRPVDGPGELIRLLDDRRHNAVVLGPGGGVGAPMRDLVLATLDSGAAVVLDADALTSFSGHPDTLATAIWQRPDRSVILTPHAGEFESLFNSLNDSDKLHSKLESVRSAARLTGAIVLLKGPDTVVSAPDGHASIAANAPPWLATAGSGDVLSGMIAGLLAQGMEGFAATSAAVWLHGAAARAFGPGLISEDIPDALPGIYDGLIGQRAG